MMIRSAIGMMVVSIDFPGELTQNACTELVQPFARHRIPATWSVSHPARVAPWLASTGARIELGVLGDSDWVGPQAGRTHFARELTLRVEAAQRAGVRLCTLALHQTRLDEHFDLLVKHRLTWVRMDEADAQASVHPHSLRYGVWQTYPTVNVPFRRSWGRPRQPSSLRAAVQRAAHESSLLHVRVHGPELLAESRRRNQLDSLFRAAHQAVLEGRLAVTTLGDLAASLVPSRRSPMRSILRRAA